jgi:hypothetical protein
MAGVKGRSGPIPDNIRTYCETAVREVAIVKMRMYLQQKPIGADDWHWCFDQLVRLGHLAVAETQDSQQERALELLA